MWFTLFITVKAITKLNLGHRNIFEIELQKNSRRRSRSSDRIYCQFAENGKEMFKEL